MATSFTFSPQQLNFFKISAVVVEEFPIALRRVFVYMWDKLASNLPGFQPWDDSRSVRMTFLNWEGGKTKVPTSLTYKKWDCTALFQATLFAKCFGVPDSSGTRHTLHEVYVKPCGLSNGTFHPSVLSPSGEQRETFALALDQLRLLRNTLCHQTSTRSIDKATFDRYICLAKAAFSALGEATVKIEVIEKLGEQDFPTERSRKLEEELEKIENIMQEIESQVDDVAAEVKEIRSVMEHVKSDVNHVKTAMKDSLKESSNYKGVPASCVPDAIPLFTGRQVECDTILHHLTGGETRVVNAWGPPGFGKTSVATSVARKLHENKLPVYFINAKGIETKDELVSKLLSVLSDACNQVSYITPSDRLIQCVRRLPNLSVLILDNVDDLVESGEPDVKAEALRFTEDVLSQCNAVKLLYTTRESMDYFAHNVSIHLEKIGVLDEVSSINLVKSMLPGVLSDVHCSTVVQTCGRVPLAMRLMCSIVEDENVSVEELLEELKTSPLVNVLDHARLPNDVRLKALISSSFQRLPRDEKEAFASLTVFPGRFREQAATHILDTKLTRKTKKIIHSLERKSLINSSDKSESFTIHSILQSFIEEKRNNDEEIEGIFRTARARFYHFYLSIFEQANNDFLTGRSFEALRVFVSERENIVSSLIGCSAEETLFYDAVAVLARAELFLYAVFTNERSLFEKLYDNSLREAQKRHDYISECRLQAAKAFGHLGWFHTNCETWYLASDQTKGDDVCPKLLSYVGVHQLLSGELEDGVHSLTRAVHRLSSGYDEVVLKVLIYHILAVCYRSKRNEKMASHFKTLSNRECTSERTSMALHFLFAKGERDSMAEQFNLSHFVIEDDFILAHLIAELLSALYTEIADYEQTKDMTYGLERFHQNVIALTEKVRGQHVDTAQLYYHLGVSKYNMGDFKGSLVNHKKALKMRQQLLGEHVEIASSYDHIGYVYLKMGDYMSAMESFQRALGLKKKHLGDHVDTAQSYHDLGVAKCEKGDLIGSLASLVQALNMRRMLLGYHTDTATSYDQLGCVYRKMGDLEAARDSFQSAAFMRTKLLGDHVDTAETFFDLGLTQFEMGKYKEALNSHERAVRLRQKLLGDHPNTASSLEILGLTYRALENHEPSIDSLQSALDMRTRLLTYCQSMESAGDNEFWTRKYREALASQQETLKTILQWFGQEGDAAVALIERGLGFLDSGDVKTAQKSFARAWNLAKGLQSADYPEERSTKCMIQTAHLCILL